MSSPKSCLICDTLLAIDSVADCCLQCTPVHEHLRKRLQFSLSKNTLEVCPEEIHSEQLLTHVAAAGRFQTANADEKYDPRVCQHGFPTVPGHTIIREIGHGSGGKVYLAKHDATDRSVAVKLVPLRDPIDRERFFREVRALAKFHHPSVVEIHEVGESDRGLYFTMEFMSGGSLGSLLREETRLSPERSAELVEQICRGMSEVHEAGLIHRDLKPGNILLDNEGNPKIADFGLVQTHSVDTGATTIQLLTITEAILGTPSYMSLEQAEARHIDIDLRSDIYGLGAILFHCLTGRPPFVGKTSYHVIQSILCEEAPSPRLFRPDLPRDLEAICLKCLARNQNERYQTTPELAEELHAWRNGLPTKVKPVSRLRPLRLFLYRERRSILPAVSVALVGSALLFLNHSIHKVNQRSLIEPPLHIFENPEEYDFGSGDNPSQDVIAQEIKQDLDAFKKVCLLGETGPRRYRPRSLRRVESVKSSFGDEYCVETISRRFIELMSEKDVPSAFILEGEIRQELSPEVVGQAGIYLGRWVSKLPDGKRWEHWIDVVFNDAWHGKRIDDNDRLYLRAVLNVTGESSLPVFLPLVLSSGNFEPLGFLRPPVWRKIRLTVRSAGVVVEQSSGDRFTTNGGICNTYIQDHQKLSFGDWLNKDPEADRWTNRPFEGGLGLIVHRCRASFRNVWIQKLEE